VNVAPSPIVVTVIGRCPGRFFAVALALWTLAAAGCGGGRETLPIGESPGRGSRRMEQAQTAGGELRVRGCVQRGEESNTFVLRLADGGPIDHPGVAANPSSSADANGGQTAAMGRTDGQAVGTSTAAGDPWPGTRAYQLSAAAGTDLERLAGSWVEVRGALASSTPSGLKGGGTDQEQARRGDPFMLLRATSIDVLPGSCPTGSIRERDRIR
jgi:hypothetical protein